MKTLFRERRAEACSENEIWPNRRLQYTFRSFQIFILKYWNECAAKAAADRDVNFLRGNDSYPLGVVQFSPQVRFHFSVLLISIFFPLASDRLPDSEPQADPIPHWSFRSHFIFPISPLSAPAVMITMSGFADSSLTCLGQRPRRGRRSKSAHMQLAQVRLSYMDRMTLSTLHHLDEPLSLAMASSLEC
jgi:hypothetical protein